LCYRMDDGGNRYPTEDGDLLLTENDTVPVVDRDEQTTDL